MNRLQHVLVAHASTKLHFDSVFFTILYKRKLEKLYFNPIHF